LQSLAVANTIILMHRNITPSPGFRDNEFLIEHIRSILRFYDPVCVDDAGGFFHFFKDDGSVYDNHTRHLVSSCRFVFNYAEAARLFENSRYLHNARHGLNFLLNHHYNPETGGYRWLIDRDQTLDGTNHAYGLAFVLLACSVALRAGIAEARQQLEDVFELMEQHFWDTKFELYRDEISADFSSLSPYRGQNANMHACEALLTAFHVTGDSKFLKRARTLAINITRRQTEESDGLIWEHYDEQWRIDWEYNRDNPQHLFRPWGFQPGHQTEWAKLLLILNESIDEDWTVKVSGQLFDRALKHAWDSHHGGICYGFNPSGEICDADKYFWVQAESIAAAARLAVVTKDEKYWHWYDKIWGYCWNHMIDHQYGAWYRILTHDNQRYDDLKSPAGKTDYHTIGACIDVMQTLKSKRQSDNS